MQENHFKSIVQQRIVEAAKKQMTQKLSTIAKNLGRPIIAHSVFDNYLPDAWELPGDDLIYDPSHVSEANECDETERGFSFDGLKIGVNLCINSLIIEDRIVELKATYNGYLVYAEIEGDLKAYAPFQVWESAVEMFYEGALVAEKKKLLREREEKLEHRKKRFGEFWKSFRLLWGE